MILINFILQAKQNVLTNENYIKANEILERNKPKNYKPKSPSQYLSKQYLKKGTSLTITTLASLVTIGEAAVNYNYLLLIATVVTIIFAIVFGIISMKSTEVYWTTEYLDYAKSIENNKLNKGDINKCLQSVINNTEILKNKS